MQGEEKKQKGRGYDDRKKEKGIGRKGKGNKGKRK